jgi:hypothetical protein
LILLNDGAALEVTALPKGNPVDATVFVPNAGVAVLDPNEKPEDCIK